MPKTDDKKPSGAELVRQPASSPPVAAEEAPERYRNISTTLLQLDNGSPFPPRGAAVVLTTEEIARFRQAEEELGIKLIQQH